MKAVIDFDFPKICQSNRLVKEWLDKLGMKHYDIFLFLKLVQNKNYNQLKNITEEQVDIINQQRDIILYTKSIENDLITQYLNMVYFVAKECGIKSSSDDHVSYGLDGLRRAVFYYNDPESNFNQYCFQGIRKGFQHWSYYKKPVKNQIIRPILATDLSDEKTEYKFEEVAIYKFEGDSDDIAEKIYNLAGDKEKLIQLISVLAEHANLSDLDVQIILGMTFDNHGRNGWVEKFISSQGLTCTKATIYNRYKQGVIRLHRAYLKMSN